jgi:hypothetical protein
MTRSFVKLLLLVAVGAAGLGILDPATLDWLGYRLGPQVAAARGVASCGSFVCLGRLGLRGLRVLDISDPSDPQVVGGQITAGLGWDIAARGRRVYLAHGLLGVGIYDIDGAGQTSYHDTLWVGGNTRSVAIRGSLLAVARKNGTVELMDVSSTPSLVGSLGAQGQVSRVRFVAGQLWILGKNEDRVEIWSVQDPAAPVRLGAFTQAAAQLFRARWLGTRVLSFDGPRLQVLRVEEVTP